MLFRAKNFISKIFLLQMYNNYAKPMISYGILVNSSAKKLNSVLFFVNKNVF